MIVEITPGYCRDLCKKYLTMLDFLDKVDGLSLNFGIIHFGLREERRHLNAIISATHMSSMVKLTTKDLMVMEFVKELAVDHGIWYE